MLHTLAGDVPGYGAVQALFTGDFVQLIYVDDAVLGAVHIPIGGLNQPEEDVFYVLADITGLGEGGGVAHSERDIQSAGQGFGQQSLAAASWADEQDVSLL